MRRTVLLAAAGWLAAAVAATATGVVAVTIIGQGLTGPQSARPLTEAEVASALASPAATTAAPTGSPAPTASPAPGGTPRSLRSPGGTVVARCDGELATLLSWAPAQGYAVGDVDTGPDDSPKVKFERGKQSIELRVRCGADGPYAELRED
ncbi:MAG TPA: septum formation initiator [Pilimelia sp.]|nr:septum formation initiator [Pilimelia sp.]